MQGNIQRVDEEFTDWFQAVVGVLQGCVLSVLLFCVFLEDVAARTLIMEDEGVVVSKSRISNFKFANDIALTAESQKELQSMIDRVITENQQFGMTVRLAFDTKDQRCRTQTDERVCLPRGENV